MSIGRLTGAEAIKTALGVAAPVVGGWFVKESYEGSKDEWQRRHAHLDANLNMDELRYSWAKYDGQPTMTKWAKRLNHMIRYGPGGIRQMVRQAKITTEGFLHDVVFKNIVPIALGITGLYAGLGKNAAGKFKVHAPFRYVNNQIIQPLWKQVKPHINGKWSKTALKGLADGIVKVGEVAIKNPGASALIAGLTAFGLLRFKRVYNGQEQDSFFRDSFRNDFWNDNTKI